MFQAYHRQNGEAYRERYDSRPAHGTNFATAAMAGFPDGIIYLEASEDGTIDMVDFRAKIKVWIRTLWSNDYQSKYSGIFEKNFKVISDEVHQVGGLVYMDGANMNAIAGIVDLDRLGVDAAQQPHKTDDPTRWRGPGDAIVAVSQKLVDFLLENKSIEMKIISTR